MERGSLFSDPFFGLEAFHWLEVPEGHKSRFLVKFVTKENEFQSQVYHNLVGGIPTPPKNMKVSWDDDIPNIWKNTKNDSNHQTVLDVLWDYNIATSKKIEQ